MKSTIHHSEVEFIVLQQNARAKSVQTLITKRHLPSYEIEVLLFPLLRAAAILLLTFYGNLLIG